MNRMNPKQNTQRQEAMRYGTDASLRCVLVVGMCLVASSSVPLFAQTRVPSRVSISTDLRPGYSSGAQGDGDSLHAVLTDDGRLVAFSSTATNLVGGDLNGHEDIFLRNRTTGQTERISLSPSGQEANNRSTWPALSGDGRFVAFMSDATNFVSGDSGSHADIYMRDRSTGAVSRVTRGLNGAEANGPSRYPSVSADGRYVAFLSLASNLVAGDTNGTADAFVADQITGVIERVSTSSTGGQADGPSTYVHIDGSGNRVVFASTASTLVPGDTNNGCTDQDDLFHPVGWLTPYAPDGRLNCSDVFLRDRGAATTTRISVTSQGTQGSGHSGWPSISRNGRVVVFGSFSDLDGSGPVQKPRGTQASGRLYGVDLQTGARQRIDTKDDGFLGIPSSDGRFVAYASLDLITGTTAAVLDKATGERTALEYERVPARMGLSAATAVSTTGDVAFVTPRTLTSADTNGRTDVYVSSLRPSCTLSLSPGTSEANRNGGVVTVDVQTSSGDCAWSTFSEVAWLVVDTPAARGTYQIRVIVSATSVSRTGRVLIGGQAFTVNQHGAECSATLASAAASVPATGGTATVAMSVNIPTCGWQTQSQPNWLSVAPASGSGSAQVTVVAAPNTSRSRRTGVVSIAGQPFTIDQPGQPTPPRQTFTRYLAEGATSTFFETQIAIVNPGATATQAKLSFLRAGKSAITREFTVAAGARFSLDPKAIPGLETGEFSTRIDSDQLLVVDRTMTWGAGAYGAHAETGVTAPAPRWYLAEGATHGGFNLFYLLQNPNDTEVPVRIRYLRGVGAPLEKDYLLPAASRTNIWVDSEDFAGAGQLLAAADVSAVIETTDGQSIIVERAMYADGHGQTFAAGHASAGITTPSTTWFLAEGATGPYFDLFILIANPATTPAAVDATFLLPDGRTIVKSYTVAPQSRFNIWVDQEDALLANTAVSTTVRSTNDVPLIVERSMWWPGNSTDWQEAHNSPGATTSGTRWALAEGETGGARNISTYILLANPTASPASIKVTLLFEDATRVERVFMVLGNSRFNVDVAAELPAARGRRFGALVESVGTNPVPIVVERSMYWDAPGQRWAAGTNALATMLP
jgi:Tol biopolymer transport system component